MDGVKLYCGVAGETKWNHHPVAPGAFTCTAPVYGKRQRRVSRVALPKDTRVVLDSGAFADTAHPRLTFEGALKRQLDHAERFNYGDQLEYVASYDVLIDESVLDGVRVKRRWFESAANEAVDTTVAAGAYLNQHRLKNVGCVMSAQGVTPSQYLDCTKRIMPYINTDTDVLGLGGWCIIGMMPKRMMPVFRDTIRQVIPYAAKQGVQRIHIWGVIYAPALGELLWMCDQHGLELSTDSSGVSVRPAQFGTWGYDDWIDHSYQKAPVETRGLDRARHVQATRDWLATMHTTRHYHEPIASVKPVEPIEIYEQLSLWAA